MMYLCNSCKFICDEDNLSYIVDNIVDDGDGYVDIIYKETCPKCDSEDIKPVRDEVEL